MTSGDKGGLRPDSAEPWIPNELVPDVSIVLSEDPEEPTYLDTVKITNLENVNQVQIRVVRTPNGPEELILADTVSCCFEKICSHSCSMIVTQRVISQNPSSLPDSYATLCILFATDVFTIVTINHNCRNTNHNCRKKHNCRNSNHNCCNLDQPKLSHLNYDNCEIL